MKSINSVEIAEVLNRQHSTVLKAIRTYKKMLEDEGIYTYPYFILSNYIDKKGESRPSFEVTRKGAEYLMSKIKSKHDRDKIDKMFTK